MEFNKKAISPVVATALLLVVAVVAVVGFQTWFTTFQSKTFVDVESQTDTGASVTVSRLQYVSGTSMTLYITNAGSADVTPTSITASGDGNTCTFPNTVIGAKNVTTITATSSCTGIAAGNTASVVLVTQSGVTESSQIVR